MALQRTAALTASTIINLIAGIWILIAPYALASSAGAKWNDSVLGILLIICAIGRMASPSVKAFSGANLIFGIWMIISPWVEGIVGGLRWNNEVVGIIVVIFSLIALGQNAIVSYPESGTGNIHRAA